MSEVEKDISVEAVPEENKALVKANSPDGMIFVKRRYEGINSVTEKAEITGDDVNDLLGDIKEAELSFSFRLAEI